MRCWRNRLLPWRPIFLTRCRHVSPRSSDNPAYLVAVKSIYDTLIFLKDGGDAAQLKGKQADPELARQIIRIDEFEKWQKEYMK